MAKIAAFEEQWFAGDPRERVGKTVTEVQLRRMPAPLAEFPVCVAANTRLLLRFWLDGDGGGSKTVIEPAARVGGAAQVNEDRDFEKVGAIDYYWHGCNHPAGQ